MIRYIVDTGFRAGRFPVRLIVRQGDHRDTSLRQSNQGGRERFLQRRAGTGSLDTGLVEQDQTVQECVGSEIQDVVVRQGDAIDLGRLEKF